MLCTQSPGGATEDDYVEMLLRARRERDRLRLRRCTPTPSPSRDRYQGLVDRRLPSCFVNGYAEGLDAPFISDDDVAADGPRRAPPGPARPHAASGLAVGPDHYVPVLRKHRGFVAASLLTFGCPRQAAEWVAH